MLSRSKPAQEQCKWVTDWLDMTLAVDRAVKPQHKQTNKKLRSKRISNDQELTQSDPTSCPQNQKGNN